jgi:hypothetical protein
MFLLGQGIDTEEVSFGSNFGKLSMSSIKRDVKKKLLPRPEERFFLEIQPTIVSLLRRSCLFSILLSFSAAGDDADEFERAASELVLQRQPWFYPRLVAYGYFWLFERA